MNTALMRACVPSIGALLLAACAGYAPSNVHTGDSADAVSKSMGAPTARYTLPQGGTRLEFARGPYGKHTYMVDLDAQGRVIAWHQVLTEPNFESVREGWSQNDLLMKLGSPSDRRSGGRQGGEVWSYRYDAHFCKWFQVGLDAQGTVVDTGYGPDPMCDDYHNIGVQ